MACTCNTSCSAALSQPPSQNLPTSGLGKPVCHSARLLGCNSAPPAGPSAAGPMATASPTTAASEQPSETAATELLVTLASEARPCLELLFLGGNEEELLFLGGEGEEPTFLDSEEEEERQVVEMEVGELEEKEVSETVEEPAARHARVMTEEHELEYRALLEASETLPPTANEVVDAILELRCEDMPVFIEMPTWVTLLLVVYPSTPSPAPSIVGEHVPNNCKVTLWAE
ncbi:uncharacterized protein UHO2_04414 [Ustilago hordei]|uniref:uncharacterized protein n=1 Tax=Ustilago hordei TaxID=120017 RepID=UPI001A5D4F54|nr:uncharacterized protein UHO2_04414 [Ustilago hordei]SYW84475.1 uncharacterized protein UHO2_04414 [Ustilago hordei]